MTTNTQPTYYAVPQRSTANPRKVIKNRVSIYEYRDGETNLVCSVGTMGLQLNDLLKRGIPYDNAKTVFYQIGEIAS